MEVSGNEASTTVPQTLTIEARVRQGLAGLGLPYERIPIAAASAETA